ncbi:MAG: hypothetical protein L6R42_008798 [Xanthoria sp. 1 TBL-2021]|nr:MAG: hypothetical protein L6R42_008798 [Xanthoria sp. 1 TBL-2021]
MLDTLSYHNSSWQGDMRWYKASKFTRYAPVIVAIILLLSIIETALGSVWIAKYGHGMSVKAQDHANAHHPRLLLFQCRSFTPPRPVAPGQSTNNNGHLALLHPLLRLPVQHAVNASFVLAIGQGISGYLAEDGMLGRHRGRADQVRNIHGNIGCIPSLQPAVGDCIPISCSRGILCFERHQSAQGSGYRRSGECGGHSRVGQDDM